MKIMTKEEEIEEEYKEEESRNKILGNCPVGYNSWMEWYNKGHKELPRQFPSWKSFQNIYDETIEICWDIKFGKHGKTAFEKENFEGEEPLTAPELPKGFSKEEWQERFETIQDFYDCLEWKRCRCAILHRDHYTCSSCGKKNSCQVHHLNDPRYTPEMALDPENLITLCDDCHTEWHKH